MISLAVVFVCLVVFSFCSPRDLTHGLGCARQMLYPLDYILSPQFWDLAFDLDLVLRTN